MKISVIFDLTWLLCWIIIIIHFVWIWISFFSFFSAPFQNNKVNKFIYYIPRKLCFRQKQLFCSVKKISKLQIFFMKFKSNTNYRGSIVKIHWITVVRLLLPVFTSSLFEYSSRLASFRTKQLLKFHYDIRTKKLLQISLAFYRICTQR